MERFTRVSKATHPYLYFASEIWARRNISLQNKICDSQNSEEGEANMVQKGQK